MGTLVWRAVAFAALAHTGHKRKYTGHSYINGHLIPVLDAVAGETFDPEVQAAAVLHDVIEDTETTHYRLVLLFGQRVADLVLELTDVFTHEAYPEINRARRKGLEAGRMATISDDAKLIKLADIANNTADIVANDPKFAVVYLAEKAVMLAQITGVDPDAEV
jgi:(p)ppGpp synthase/HD superfamily hydrolase